MVRPRPLFLPLFMAFALAASTPRPDLIRLDGSRLGAAEADRLVSGLMAKANVTGLGVAVLNNGKVVYQRAFGFRDGDRKLPLTEDTVMYGASFTKPVFAVAVMQQVDEGRVDLDRPVLAYLPRPISTYESWEDLAADPRHARLTARMLLSHTAGFANYRFLNPDGRLRIFFEPGSRYAYSGEGLNLLQMVLEAHLGTPIGGLIQAGIFDRFGMARSSLTWREDFSENLAMGHDAGGKVLGHRRQSRVRVAGSMDTTLADMGRFLEGVLRGDGLSAAAKREMLRPQIRIHSKQQFPTLSSETTRDNDAIALSYGLGWGLFRSRRHGPAFFKEGHDDGWENHLVAFGDSGSGLILMSNSSNGDCIFKDLLERLLGDLETPWYWEGYLPCSGQPVKP